MKIYTDRGDEEVVDLRDTTHVPRISHQIEACGTVDEMNVLVGTVRPTGHGDVNDVLEAVQNHLHTVQADLANPDPDEGDLQVAADHVDELEAWIDEADEELDSLTSFIPPDGSEMGAKLHHAHAVLRRAEYRIISLAAEGPVDKGVVAYLDRPSDALFIFAQLVNTRDEVPKELPTYQV